MMAPVIVLLATMGNYAMPHVQGGALETMVFVKTMAHAIVTQDLLERTAVWSAVLEMGAPQSGEYMVRVTQKADVCAMLGGQDRIAIAMTNLLVVIEALAATLRARVCAKTNFRARVVRCAMI